MEYDQTESVPFGHIQFVEHGMCEPSSWVLQPRAPVRDALPLGQLGLDVRARLGLGLVDDRARLGLGLDLHMPTLLLISETIIRTASSDV